MFDDGCFADAMTAARYLSPKIERRRAAADLHARAREECRRRLLATRPPRPGAGDAPPPLPDPGRMQRDLTRTRRRLDARRREGNDAAVRLAAAAAEGDAREARLRGHLATVRAGRARLERLRRCLLRPSSDAGDAAEGGDDDAADGGGLADALAAGRQQIRQLRFAMACEVRMRECKLPAAGTGESCLVRGASGPRPPRPREGGAVSGGGHCLGPKGGGRPSPSSPGGRPSPSFPGEGHVRQEQGGGRPRRPRAWRAVQGANAARPRRSRAWTKSRPWRMRPWPRARPRGTRLRPLAMAMATSTADEAVATATSTADEAVAEGTFTVNEVVAERAFAANEVVAEGASTADEAVARGASAVDEGVEDVAEVASTALEGEAASTAFEGVA